MTKRWFAFAALPLFFLTILPVAAQTSGIYTCVDAQGRRHTSDRPIAACIDREQKRLSKTTGVVQGVIPPSYTAEEQAAIATRKKQEEELRKQERTKAKTMTALLQRYPTQTAHMAARKADAEPILARIREGQARIEQIKSDRVKLEQELEFYKKRPDSMPAALRRQVQASTDSEQSALRYIANQQKELEVLNKRYDAEQTLLQTLWK